MYIHLGTQLDQLAFHTIMPLGLIIAGKKHEEREREREREREKDLSSFHPGPSKDFAFLQ